MGERATSSSLVNLQLCGAVSRSQRRVRPSILLPVRMPQVLFREGKGTRVPLAIFRHSLKRGEGRMLMAPGVLFTPSTRSGTSVTWGSFPPSATELLAAMAGGWFLPPGLPSPAVGQALLSAACREGTFSFSIPAAFAPAVCFIFFAGELSRGTQLVTLPDSHLPVT